MKRSWSIGQKTGCNSEQAQANSKLSAFVLLLAIMAISLFLAFFYRKFRWEMMEQRYKELMAHKKRAETTAGKQL
jgi:hypothetical protein